MAHFAELNEENVVLRVIVIENSVLVGDLGIEEEENGVLFCKNIFGENTKWVQTSYNGNFRKNYACIGGFYDNEKDAFIYPKPFDSWVLNKENYKWEAPIPYPTDGELYIWNEELTNWELAVTE